MADNMQASRRRQLLDQVAVDIDSIIQQAGRLPLARPDLAEKQLAALLETALAVPAGTEDLFVLLEYVRTPLSFVREAAVRHYHAQAPMLDEDSDAHFQHGIDAWQRMVRGYSLCLGAAEASHPAPLPERIATLAHRCLFYQSLLIFEHYRAKRQLPPGVWQQLHRFYGVAEKFGSTRRSVRDELFGEVRTTDCQAAYIAPLLIAAARPFGHDSRQLEAIHRWAGQWAHLVAISPHGANRHRDGFIVDLNQDASHQAAAESSPAAHVRLVDTTGLVAHLRRLLNLLDRRPPPESFGLSEDNISWTRPLLAEVEEAWTPCQESRRSPRVPHRSALNLTVGFERIHALASGHSAAVAGPVDGSLVTEPAGEDWYLVEESRTGCRLIHPAPRTHLHLHQLVALDHQGSRTCRLAQIQWLMQDSLRGIVAGIAFLPGVAKAVSVRSEHSVGGKGRFLGRAFLLADHDTGAKGLILMPKDMFKPGRMVGISNGGDTLAALKEIVQSGLDFDLVALG